MTIGGSTTVTVNLNTNKARDPKHTHLGLRVGPKAAL